MYILSVDTTAKTASVCISKYTGGKLRPVSHSTVNGTLTHSESLLPMIDFCLKNANMSFQDISTVAITTGPGSFTGVRIGVATVKGLVFTKPDVKCIAVSSLESLAYNLLGYGDNVVILSLMDARRHQFYNAVFRKNDDNSRIVRLCPDNLTEFDNIIAFLEENYKNSDIVLTGDGAELFFKLYNELENKNISVRLCDSSNIYQSAYSVAMCAVKNNSFVCANDLSPTYLRESQAERERNEKISGGK